CIGDRYRIGSAEFEVTQPRVTCYRVGIRMNEPRLPALLVAHHRPGFYFRVLQAGEVGAGADIVRSRRCSNKIRAPKLWQEIRDSPMRNNRQHGPDFDRCESRVFTRRAIASLPSFWSQSMGSFFLSARRVSLSFCACISTRTTPRSFAAIRCLMRLQPTISASASKTN